MSIKTYNKEEIEKKLPHKFENLLVDSLTVTSNEPLSATLDLMITEDDSLGRDIFLNISKISLISFALSMEFLALGSIMCLDIPEKHLYIFTGISDLKVFHNFSIGQKIHGEVVKTGQKGPLIQCKGNIYNEDRVLLATGCLKASLVHEDILSRINPDLSPFSPETNCSIKQAFSSNYKTPSMCFVDELLFLDESQDNFSASFSYTYPSTHPCVRGHFPEGPIMMGVMQLTSLEDCALLLSQNLSKKYSGDYVLIGDASIKSASGATIAIIKGFSIEISSNKSDLLSIKKVGFKSMVLPEEIFYVQFTNLSISESQ